MIGLFLGAVILALAYELQLAWLDPDSVEQVLSDAAEEERPK